MHPKVIKVFYQEIRFLFTLKLVGGEGTVFIHFSLASLELFTKNVFATIIFLDM